MHGLLIFENSIVKNDENERITGWRVKATAR